MLFVKDKPAQLSCLSEPHMQIMSPQSRLFAKKVTQTEQLPGSASQEKETSDVAVTHHRVPLQHKSCASRAFEHPQALVTALQDHWLKVKWNLKKPRSHPPAKLKCPIKTNCTQSPRPSTLVSISRFQRCNVEVFLGKLCPHFLNISNKHDLMWIYCVSNHDSFLLLSDLT